MALDTPINRSVLVNVFPDLAKDKNFKILSECSDVYNCIAWAMGYTDRWVDHIEGAGHWWPKGVDRNADPETLISAFKAEGFEISENHLFEKGYSKVILYKSKEKEEWTHAARVITSDIEYSKFGRAWDGQHSHDVLCRTGLGKEPQSYGIAYAYMKRKDSEVEETTLEYGTISVNTENLAKLRALLKK